jgi:hypothetical protein
MEMMFAHIEVYPLGSSIFLVNKLTVVEEQDPTTLRSFIHKYIMEEDPTIAFNPETDIHSVKNGTTDISDLLNHPVSIILPALRGQYCKKITVVIIHRGQAGKVRVSVRVEHAPEQSLKRGRS